MLCKCAAWFRPSWTLDTLSVPQLISVILREDVSKLGIHLLLEVYRQRDAIKLFLLLVSYT